MKYRPRKYRLAIAVLVSLVVFASKVTAFTPLEPLADHYEQVPTFLASSEAPTVMIIIDTSGSMCLRASGSAFNPLNRYSGYFDSGEYYIYTSNLPENATNDLTGNYFEIDSSAGATTSGTNWSGNWLNWMTMRRMDGAKQALTGGERTAPDANNDGLVDFVIHEANSNCDNYANDKSASYNDSNGVTDLNGNFRHMTPNHSNKTYTLNASTSNPAGGTEVLEGPGPDLRVRVLADSNSYDASTGPVGLIQRTAGRIRYGVTYFNNGNGGAVVVPVGGNDKTDSADDVLQEVVASLNTARAGGGTPLAEALYTVVGYFARNFTNSNGPRYDGDDSYSNDVIVDTNADGFDDNWDAFYFSADKPAVFCSDINILLITDGQPTGDGNIDTIRANFGTSSSVFPQRTIEWELTGNDNRLDNVAFWAHTLSQPDPLHSNTVNFNTTGLPDATDDLRPDLAFTQNINLYTVMAFGSGLNILRNAAINGSFDDLRGNGDGNPNTLEQECRAAIEDKEWDFDGDNVCNYTDVNGNGVFDTGDTWISGTANPDNYMVAQDATALANALAQAFSDILTRMSVGSASSVMSTSRTGEGAAFQAIYLPLLEDNNNRKVSWVGDVHAFLTDESGNLRLDSNHNGYLDCGDEDKDNDGFIDPGEDRNNNGVLDEGDKVAVVFYDGAEQASMVRIFTDANGNCKLDPGEDLDLDGNLDVHEDLNNNGLLDFSETDTDFDGDGNTTDVYEDTVIVNCQLDPGEDVDGDGHLDTGEDVDCDGRLDVNEDVNGNGVLDAAEAATFTEEFLMYTDFLWSGSERLGSIPGIDLPIQGAFPLSSRLSSRRYIFTGYDSNGDGSVSRHETYDFVTTGADSIALVPEIRRYFRIEDVDGAGDLDSGDDLNGDGLLDRPKLNLATLIDYTRGVEYDGNPTTEPNLRSRVIGLDPNGDNVDEITRNWILGDIINSAPIDVNIPAENFDQLYKDQSYRLFAKKYLKRRHVIYTGGNDGMLHAFNGGFYDKKNKKYWRSMIWEVDNGNDILEAGEDVNGNGIFDGVLADDFGSEIDPDGTGLTLTAGVGPELGDELWAYIPYNSLPHLAWLSDTTYDHMAFLDTPIRVADVKIFTPEAACSSAAGIYHPECVHPGGWGTILIAGMGFGGGPISVDSDIPLGSITNADRVLSSSFSIFDVTNPEQEPILLMEFSLQDEIDSATNFSFTTSFPTVVQMKNETTPGDGNIDWYVFFGSGPTTLKGESDQPGKLYLLPLDHNQSSSSLRLGSFLTNGTNKFRVEIPTANSFISDLASADFEVGRDDNAFKDDAIYFGSVAGSFSGGWDGALYRFGIKSDPNPANWTLDLVLDVDRPIVSAPLISIDPDENIWVYGGTGRFYDELDSVDDGDEILFGVKDPLLWGTEDMTTPSVAMAALLDVTDSKVYEQTSASSSVVELPRVAGVATFQDLLDEIDFRSGWKREFTATDEERSIVRGLVFEQHVFAPSYMPATTACSAEGTSNLYGLYYLTGTSYFKNLFGVDTSDSVTDTDGVHFLVKATLGAFMGKLETPAVTQTGKDEKTRLNVQSSTGQVVELKTDTQGSAYSRTGFWVPDATCQ